MSIVSDPRTSLSWSIGVLRNDEMGWTNIALAVSAAIPERFFASNNAVGDFCKGDRSVAPQATRHLQKISTYRIKC
jgi:hypothetical protein